MLVNKYDWFEISKFKWPIPSPVIRDHQVGLKWPKIKSSQVDLTWLEVQVRDFWLDLTWLENWKGGQRLDFDLNLRWHGVYHSESTMGWGHGVQGGDRMCIYGTNPSPSSDNFSFGYWLDLTWSRFLTFRLDLTWLDIFLKIHRLDLTIFNVILIWLDLTWKIFEI